MLSLFDLTGKTALVTGGTRGIGQAMTLALAEAGADIVILQRNAEDDETSKTIQQLKRKCTTYICDMASRESLSTVIQTVVSAHTISIVLNAAGIQRRVPAEKFTLEDYDAVLQVNLTSTFSVCREIGAHWLATGQKGVIINVASLASFQGGVNMAAYAASKGGVLQLTKALSNEWAGRGIRVNCVAPGYIETNINLDTRTDPDKRANFESITNRIPMGRWGVPDEFKGVAVFMASDASSYMSGECVTIDGGWMAR